MPFEGEASVKPDPQPPHCALDCWGPGCPILACCGGLDWLDRQSCTDLDIGVILVFLPREVLSFGLISGEKDLVFFPPS
jgi:hypothetical protein